VSWRISAESDGLGRPAEIGMIEPYTNRLENMNYPVVIHKDKDSDYGVTVPDLSGCFTAGCASPGAVVCFLFMMDFFQRGIISPLPDSAISGPSYNRRTRLIFQGIRVADGNFKATCENDSTPALGISYLGWRSWCSR
jgi:hypothetical protein